jgi:hypothetical protein
MRSVGPERLRTVRGAALRVAAPLAIALLASSCASKPPAPAAFAQVPAATAKAPAASAKAPAASATVPGAASISADALGLYRSMDAARAAPTADELAVVDSAKRLLGMAPNALVVVEGRQFKLDCIGTVCAIYYRLGLDVAKDFGKYPGNGVNRLYRSLEARGLLHGDRYPRTGDIVIWDNTWDADGDGDRSNDLNTHAGVVLAVDDDGTIHYVHENMYKGVMIETMNLLRPTESTDASGKKINSGMAIATVSGGPKPARWLSGDVFKAFGDILRAKDDFRAAAVPAGAVALAR